jgi:hypothetical protein
MTYDDSILQHLRQETRHLPAVERRSSGRWPRTADPGGPAAAGHGRPKHPAKDRRSHGRSTRAPPGRASRGKIRVRAPAAGPSACRHARVRPCCGALPRRFVAPASEQRLAGAAALGQNQGFLSHAPFLDDNTRNLVSRALDQDRDAIDLLFQRYRDRLRAALRKLIGPKYRLLMADSEDATHDAILSALAAAAPVRVPRRRLVPGLAAEGRRVRDRAAHPRPRDAEAHGSGRPRRHRRDDRTGASPTKDATPSQMHDESRTRRTHPRGAAAAARSRARDHRAAALPRTRHRRDLRRDGPADRRVGARPAVACPGALVGAAVAHPGGRDVVRSPTGTAAGNAEPAGCGE